MMISPARYLRILRSLTAAAFAAHGLVHLTIWPGAPAWPEGRLGWTGQTWLTAPSAATAILAPVSILTVVALHLVGSVLLASKGWRRAPAWIILGSAASLALFGAAWPGFTPTPSHFWRGPVISAGFLLVAAVLAKAAHSGEDFQTSWSARSRLAAWGSTARQREHPESVARVLRERIGREPNLYAWRGVEVAAPTEVTAGWLGQLRFAPYSYDWLDNRGRRSPGQRNLAAASVRAGDKILGLFEVAAVDVHGGFSAAAAGPPPTAVSYRVIPTGTDTSRLEVDLAAAVESRLGGILLVSIDWLMMRRQLLNLAGLASREASTAHLKEIVTPL